MPAKSSDKVSNDSAKATLSNPQLPEASLRKSGCKKWTRKLCLTGQCNDKEQMKCIISSADERALCPFSVLNCGIASGWKFVVNPRDSFSLGGKYALSPHKQDAM